MTARARKPKHAVRTEQPPDMLLLLGLAWALFGPRNELTPDQAGDLIGRSGACVRVWARRGLIGRWDARLRTWLISHHELVEFVQARPRSWRTMPRALQQFTGVKTAGVLSSSHEYLTPATKNRSAHRGRAKAAR